MKYFLIATASLCMIVLSGCMSISEPVAPALTGKFATEANLHLEGFLLYTVRENSITPDTLTEQLTISELTAGLLAPAPTPERPTNGCLTINSRRS